MASRPVAYSVFAKRASRYAPSGLGVKRIELAFRYWPVTPSELYGDIVKPAGSEAAVKVPQAWHNHAYNGDLDIRTRLIEDKEVKARSLDAVYACHDLLAFIETAKFRAQVRPNLRLPVRR